MTALQQVADAIRKAHLRHHGVSDPPDWGDINGTDRQRWLELAAAGLAALNIRAL